jgi:hypothetical protein
MPNIVMLSFTKFVCAVSLLIVIMLGVIMLSVKNAECHWTDCCSPAHVSVI